MRNVTKSSLNTNKILLNVTFILAATFIVFYILLVSQIPTIDSYMIPRLDKLNNKLASHLNTVNSNSKIISEKIDMQNQHLDEMNKKLDKKLVEIEDKLK